MPAAGDWPAVNELLDEALDLPPPQRPVWLAALPEQHAPLRDTLARLLAMQIGLETGDFLGTLPKLDAAPAAAMGGPDFGTPQRGDEVGPWRLLREIGEGGMGSVWLAERADGSLKRQVALKLPRLSWQRGLAERMARERDILATLEHPHIARLYDAGVDTLGRPWLALEYVQGQPIDEHARILGLDVKRRVQLLLQVCEAVAYAHSRLVIHRDLKPSNILVTDDGQVKLLDFGIAKLVQGDGAAQATALTELSGHAMTLDYASPEQVRGEALTTASDVYSLGVVAYELLAGAKPYRLRRGSQVELEEAITAGEVRPPSELAAAAVRKSLRGNLDAVVLQAMRKSIAGRYPSVEALAKDLQQHLNGDAVTARAERFAERLRRLSRRHALAVTAGTAAALALTIGSGLALWQAAEARAASAQARQDAATAQAVQGFIESVFHTTSGDQVSPAQARATTARELLDRGAARIASEMADAPLARLRLLGLMASMYEDMQVLDRALALQEQRVATALEALGPRSDDAIAARADLAHALSLVGREADGRRELDQAAATLETRPDAKIEVRARVALRQASSRLEPDPAAALRAAERALELVRGKPASAELVMALHTLGENASYAGKPERAAKVLREAIALVKARPALGANMQAAMQASLGDALAGLGQLKEAEAAYRSAVAAEAQRGSGGQLLPQLQMQLGNFLFNAARYREAADAQAPGARWARQQQGMQDAMVPMMVLSHGRSLRAMGRVDEALAELDVADRQLQGIQLAPDLLVVAALTRAQALIDQGRLTQAEQAQLKAKALIEQHQTRQERFLSPVRRQWLLASGLAPQALQEWQAARKAGSSAARPDDAAPLVVEAQLQLAAGAIDSARVLAESALSALQSKPDQPSARLYEAQAQATLGRALLRQGQAEKALPVLLQAAQAHRVDHDVSHSLWQADLLGTVARARRATGDAPGAAAALREARAIHARHSLVGAQHLQVLSEATAASGATVVAR